MCVRMHVRPSVWRDIHTYTTHTYIHTYIYIYTTVGVAHVMRRVTPSQRACRSRQQKMCSGRAAIWRQGSSHGGPSDQQPHAPDARQGRTAARAGCRSGRNARQGHRLRRASEIESERARVVVVLVAVVEGEGKQAEAVVVCQIQHRDATEAHSLALSCWDPITACRGSIAMPAQSVCRAAFDALSSCFWAACAACLSAHHPPPVPWVLSSALPAPFIIKPSPCSCSCSPPHPIPSPSYPILDSATPVPRPNPHRQTKSC